MNSIEKFTEGSKTLFLFELDGKVATIAPELMAFEGYKDVTSSWRDVKNREEFEEGFEFKTLKSNDLKVFKEILLNTQDLSLVLGDLPKTLYEQYKSVPRLDIVFEEGIFGTMYSSNSGHANKFKKFMRREVNPKLNSDGKFDLVENEISKIEDEKERLLRSKIKGYEDLLVLDSSDRMANAMLSNYKLELNQYLQSKEIKEVKTQVKEIENKVNRTAIIREGDCTAEAVAKRFNVFSTSNKPHAAFTTNIAKKLGFYLNPEGNVGYMDDYITINLVQRGGKDVATVKYSELAIKEIENHLNDEGLAFEEVKYLKLKNDKDKGKFERAKIAFDTGNIWVNETTYNLYN